MRTLEHASGKRRYHTWALPEGKGIGQIPYYCHQFNFNRNRKSSIKTKAPENILAPAFLVIFYQ